MIGGAGVGTGAGLIVVGLPSQGMGFQGWSCFACSPAGSLPVLVHPCDGEPLITVPPTRPTNQLLTHPPTRALRSTAAARRLCTSQNHAPGRCRLQPRHAHAHPAPSPPFLVTHAGRLVVLEDRSTGTVALRVYTMYCRHLGVILAVLITIALFVGQVRAPPAGGALPRTVLYMRPPSCTANDLTSRSQAPHACMATHR